MKHLVLKIRKTHTARSPKNSKESLKHLVLKIRKTHFARSSRTRKTCKACSTDKSSLYEANTLANAEILYTVYCEIHINIPSCSPN